MYLLSCSSAIYSYSAAEYVVANSEGAETQMPAIKSLGVVNEKGKNNAVLRLQTHDWWQDPELVAHWM